MTPGRWVEFDPTRDDRGEIVPGGDIEIRVFDDEFDVADLAVVKVDVEGNEPGVLAGMAGHLDRCSPLVYSETHTEEAHAAAAEVLEPLGFSMTRAIHMGSTMERWER